MATALTALDDDEHALAIDVADLKRRHLRDTQPSTIGDGEGGAMLETGGHSKQARGLVGAEHNRESTRVAQAAQLRERFGRSTVWLSKEKRSTAKVLFIAGEFMPRSGCSI